MLISQYNAAQIAGVTRQAINLQCRSLPMPGYFIETKKGYLVDEDHPEFLEYCRKIEEKKKRKRFKNGDEARFNRLLQAVVDTIREAFELDDDKLNAILDKIDKKYQAM